MNADGTGHRYLPIGTRTLLALFTHACALGFVSSQAFAATDVFELEAVARDDATTRWTACNLEALPASPLTLDAAVERALCANPKTQEAWATVRTQVAGLGLSRAAYLPSLSANVQRSVAGQATNVADHPELSSSYRQGSNTQSLILNWVLYDFGRRAADERASQHSLSAAQANLSAVLLEEFVDVARAFYAVQAADGALRAAEAIDATAKSSYAAAQERVDKGVAPITDALQAKTSYTEALLQLRKAQGDLLLTRGVLAGHLAMPPDTAFRLPPIEEQLPIDHTDQASITELISRAQTTHPRTLEAMAQANVAIARLSAARAETLPTVTLSLNASRNDTPVSATLGSPRLATHTTDKGVVLTVSIPLFDGFGRYYKIDQAEHQLEAEKAHGEVVRQQVGLDVWSAFQELRTAEHSVEQVNLLMDVARESHAAARERYLAGVGSVVDLLNAQGALAAARRRNLQALADWQTAKLVLAGRRGILPGLSDQ